MIQLIMYLHTKKPHFGDANDRIINWIKSKKLNVSLGIIQYLYFQTEKEVQDNIDFCDIVWIDMSQNKSYFKSVFFC